MLKRDVTGELLRYGFSYLSHLVVVYHLLEPVN